MGRKRKYHTPEEQRIAANLKSRKSYHKNKNIVNARRRSNYHVGVKKNPTVELRSECVTRSSRNELQPTLMAVQPPMNFQNAQKLQNKEAITSSSSDDPENVMYWKVQVAKVLRKHRKFVGNSPFDFMERLYTCTLASRKTQPVFDAIVRAERLERYIQKYQGEILQLVGVGKDWREAEQAVKEVSQFAKCLADLGFAVAVDPDDAHPLHRQKQLMYQNTYVP
ncbi:hypothetical protein C0992_012243 [Termitomyces sp. T32_za158]|nr:hypothetical protein C0992_012243 [Termitomyces sp. T32_za158]